MKTLIFDLAEVGANLRHSMACTQWKQTYGETTQRVGLWWVKDEGTYLMSNGIAEGLQPPVAYARGLGADAEWDTVQEYCGGDDFAQFIDICDIPNAGYLVCGQYIKGTVHITFNDDHYMLSVHVKPARKKRVA